MISVKAALRRGRSRIGHPRWDVQFGTWCPRWDVAVGTYVPSGTSWPGLSDVLDRTFRIGRPICVPSRTWCPIWDVPSRMSRLVHHMSHSTTAPSYCMDNMRHILCVYNQFDPNPLSYTELSEAVLSCYISTALILTEGLPLFDTLILVSNKFT